MSKRRSKKKSKSTKPNIPQETLQRARQQAGLEAAPDPTKPQEAAEVDEQREAIAEEASNLQPEAVAAEAAETVAAAETEQEPEVGATDADQTAAARAQRARERRRASTASSSASRRRTQRQVTPEQLARAKRKGEELDQEQIAYLLSHPTKQVGNDELRAEYGFVLRDLRNMGLLAALLFVLLVALAQFL